MKRATVRDLRGKPFARLVPEPSVRSFFGAGAGTVNLPRDIYDRVAAAWEASE